jgi:16S rRNA (cytosine1402-N4)-methyltransferase
MTYTSHYSVLKKECLDSLLEKHDKNGKWVFADLTFGGGGHTIALAQAFPNSIIYSTDQDPEALENGHNILKENGLEKRVTLIDTNFVFFPNWLEENAPHVKLDGVIADLGVSSHHFDKHERGFSFLGDAVLDMRMNTADSTIKTAREIVNLYSEKDLVDIFKNYGEEKLAKKIASRIVDYRKKAEIDTTKELENIIFHSYPPKQRHGRIHPATRVFQALRIEVNQELKVLEELIPRLLPVLSIGGRLNFISFHSLEDRIIKHSFKSLLKSDLPCQIITKKPILPTEKEISENSRSRSAKMRVLERVKDWPSKNKYKKDFI